MSSVISPASIVNIANIEGIKDRQAYFQPVTDALAQVKESLLAIVPPESQLLAGTVGQSLNSGGKYLRPAVTLLTGLASQRLKKDRQQSSAAVDDEAFSRHAMIEVAAVSEMIHIATLLHDDVLDEALLRRGKETVRAALGNKISVLSGDYLLAQASLKLAKLGNTRLVSIYAQVLADLCDGEVEQMRQSYRLTDDPAVIWESYRRKTYCKTASLFAAGCEAAGVVNDLPESDIQALRRFGAQFGLAFQVVDDLLDYTSSEAELGKPVFEDLRNGLLNAPVLLALASDKLSPLEQQHFQALLQQVFDARLQEQAQEEATANASAQGRKLQELEPKNWQDQVQSYLSKAEAAEQTRAMVAAAVQEAIDALAALPACEEKTALVGLAQSIADRRS